MGMKNKKTVVFLTSFFILLAAGFSFWAYPVIKNSRKTKIGFFGDPGHSIRPFKFANQLGDSITLDNLKGKIVVVEYFFSTCKGICPTMNENMEKVYAAFKNDNDVLILSHTVDPERDSVEALATYSQQFAADPEHWMFLTGDKKALYDQARYSYLITAVENENVEIEDDFIHEKYFVLVDKHGRLRAHEDNNGKLSLYDGTDDASVQQLIKDIRELKSE